MGKENDIKVEIVDSMGYITMKENGSSQQVNIVKWNGGEPKIDIRNWSPTQTPWKGISIEPKDLDTLIALLEQARSRIGE